MTTLRCDDIVTTYKPTDLAARVDVFQFHENKLLDDENNKTLNIRYHIDIEQLKPAINMQIFTSKILDEINTSIQTSELIDKKRLSDDLESLMREIAKLCNATGLTLSEIFLKV